IINTVLGLFLKDMDFNGVSYKGLDISGIKIPIINNTTGKLNLDINGILANLLKGFYSYQSSAIKPIWEFYTSEIEQNEITYDISGKAVDGYKWAAAKHFASFERAEYLATVHGTMIGSVLIGDTLGTGQYPSSFGLSDLQSVQQYKTDMSYQPIFFPLYSFRDMLALFAGMVMLFYFLSFVAAQKEENYATGKTVALTRKEKKQLLIEEAMRADSIALDENDNLTQENGVTDEQAVSEQSVNEESNAVNESSEESPIEESVAETENTPIEETLFEDELNLAEENNSVETEDVVSNEESGAETTEEESLFENEEDNRADDVYLEENDFAGIDSVEQSSEEAQTENEYHSDVTAEFQEEAPLQMEELNVENAEFNETPELFESTEENAEVANDIAETTEDTALPVEEDFDKEVR
ncbi:MAG: hypothetical protein K2G31_00150, partial [Clostridia bacterium]|nr:hypothetical protein [Clostridia bacterium]